MSERWRKVPGWPYEASTAGRVRSMPRTLANGAVHGGQVLEPVADKDGYLRVTLTDGRRRGTLGVHQAVLLAFAGPPEARHLNGDVRDNTPGNLAWGSRRDNERDKRTGQARPGGPGPVRVNGETEETEDGIGTGVSHPSDAVSPAPGGLLR